jgi:cysteine-rich repeat protein
MCGDGIVEGAEACDDMNTVAGDGCTACMIDAGYHCSGAPSVCVTTLPGDTCGNAIPVTASGTFTGTYTGYFNDEDPGDSGCTGFSEVGPDVIYAVTMGAGQLLQATLTPNDSQDVALYVLTDCGQPVTSCAAGADNGSGGDAETVSYTSATAQTVYLVVDGYSDFNLAGPYSLALSVSTPMCGNGVLEGAEQCDDGNTTAGDGCTGCVIDPGYHCSGSPSACMLAAPGDVCASPIKIGGSGSTAGTFDGFTNDYDPGGSGCTSYSEPGPDVAYSIIMVAGQMLTATVTPGNDQDVALYLVTDCSDLANTCAVGEDTGSAGAPETLNYTSPAAQTVYLIVDSFISDATGPFTLDVTLQ